ncbi:MAG: zinc-binding dehydrogenase [Candidatus Eremiobacteraeota bacterium]|nr:zinc-binding dehydrogenase [Candidatus Eremiobacteraeota bacterium]
MMKAVRLHQLGGVQNLQLDQVAEPAPGAGEILVRLSAAALNHRDVYITQGLYPGIELPVILGSDGTGTIAALGEGVSAPAVGTPVVINPMLDWGDNPRVWSSRATILGMPRAGTLADYVSVPAQNVAPTPQGLSDEEAAALPLGGLTAYRATFTRGRISAKDTVLVTGVGGGVQTFVLLFCKHIGARVIVTSSRDEKLDRAKALGADETLNYRNDPEWYKAARKIGVDVAIDSAGGETLARVIDIVKPGGRVVTYGGTTGDAKIRPFSIFWHQRDVLGTSMGSPEDFSAMLKLFTGGLRPVVDRTFELADIVAAAERLEHADQFGKVVLHIS